MELSDKSCKFDTILMVEEIIPYNNFALIFIAVMLKTKF